MDSATTAAAKADARLGIQLGTVEVAAAFALLGDVWAIAAGHYGIAALATAAMAGARVFPLIARPLSESSLASGVAEALPVQGKRIVRVTVEQEGEREYVDTGVLWIERDVLRFLGLRTHMAIPARLSRLVREDSEDGSQRLEVESFGRRTYLKLTWQRDVEPGQKPLLEVLESWVDRTGAETPAHLPVPSLKSESLLTLKEPAMREAITMGVVAVLTLVVRYVPLPFLPHGFGQAAVLALAVTTLVYLVKSMVAFFRVSRSRRAAALEAVMERYRRLEGQGP